MDCTKTQKPQQAATARRENAVRRGDSGSIGSVSFVDDPQAARVAKAAVAQLQPPSKPSQPRHAGPPVRPKPATR